MWGTSRGQEGLPSLGTGSSQLMGSSCCLSSSSQGEHVHMTELCKPERPLHMYKTSAWSLAIGLFKPWSTAS